METSFKIYNQPLFIFFVESNKKELFAYEIVEKTALFDLGLFFCFGFNLFGRTIESMVFFNFVKLL